MLKDIDLGKVLFLDIETVPVCESYKDLPDNFKAFWDRKASFISKSADDTPETLYERAGIYAEFGKIICISTGYLYTVEGGEKEFRTKSFYGHDEKKLLQEFIVLLDGHYRGGDKILCAHNGKEFDFPYLARRMLINGLIIPAILDVSGKKPWEISHLDTMMLWKFGDFKNYTSLDLLAAVFGLPTPKNDIGGSDVARVYWKEKNLDRIVEYCRKDVLTVAQIVLKFKGEPAVKVSS